jgi:diadenosine tetraphosphate (Ap4A) HIT family hydrolase
VSFELPDAGIENCTFCSIIGTDIEANWEADPTGDSRVACFHNQLKWARVMLLVVPVEHLTQSEFWSSDTLVEAGKFAVDMGDKHCADEGYRAISNFGRQAHQSQVHGHIHIVSGTSQIIQNANRKSHLRSDGEFSVDEFEVEETPFAAQIAPENGVAQRQMWGSDQILREARAALDITNEHSPNGFRLMSSFEPKSSAKPAGANPASLFVLGGGQLGLYV